ncbi:MAG TPA: hypothetical protein VMG35_24545 [Bryobacteraceae bacterium]|nr:hypothetical protein [Bryobacteraceae bacterium]
MSRFWKAPLIAAIALGTVMIAAPAASAMPGPRVVVRRGFYGGHFYGRGWYRPAWGWGWGWGGGWWGPGWYGAWGPGYYYGPPEGHVKIVTHDKAASIYVDGGYVGTVAQDKKFALRPGAHDVEVRDPSGRVLYNQRVEVLRGKTIDIHPAHGG